MFAKLETPETSAHLDRSVWTEECVWMSYYACIELCHFFGLLHCMAFTISDKKHIKKQYKSRLCHQFIHFLPLIQHTVMAGWCLSQSRGPPWTGLSHQYYHLTPTSNQESPNNLVSMIFKYGSQGVFLDRTQA